MWAWLAGVVGVAAAGPEAPGAASVVAPIVGVRLDAILDTDASRDLGGVGGGVVVGVRVASPLWVEGLVDVTAGRGTPPRVGASLGLRGFLLDRDRMAMAPSVGVGGGVDALGALGGARPLVRADLAVDLLPHPAFAARVAGGVIWTGAQRAAPEVSVALVWAPRRARTPDPASDPVVAQPPVAPREGPQWLGAPACRWADDEAAQVVLAAFDGAADDVTAAEDAAEVPAAPARPAGGFVVVAYPGDEVRVGGVLVDVGPDGVASVVGGAREVEVEVRGGGRLESLRLYPSQAIGIWRRVGAPVDVDVRFELGSAEIAAADRARLATLAANTAGWGWQLAGWYSPEGSLDANLALARTRALAVRDALVAAGVPAASVRIVEAGMGPADYTPEQMRAVRATPVPPGGEP